MSEELTSNGYLAKSENNCSTNTLINIFGEVSSSRDEVNVAHNENDEQSSTKMENSDEFLINESNKRTDLYNAVKKKSKARKIDDKLVKILKHYNISERELFSKLKNVKRKTVEKRKKCVLSCKVNNRFSRKKLRKRIDKKILTKQEEQKINTLIEEKPLNLSLKEIQPIKCRDDNENIELKNSNLSKNHKITEDCEILKKSVEKTNEEIINGINSSTTVDSDLNIVKINITSVDASSIIMENGVKSPEEKNIMTDIINYDNVNVNDKNNIKILEDCADKEKNILNSFAVKTKPEQKNNGITIENKLLMIDNGNTEKNLPDENFTVQSYQQVIENNCKEDILINSVENESDSIQIEHEPNMCHTVENDINNKTCFEEIGAKMCIENNCIETFSEACDVIEDSLTSESNLDLVETKTNILFNSDTPSAPVGPLFSSFKTDDDIRSKIKLQLELLRNKKAIKNTPQPSTSENPVKNFPEENISKENFDKSTPIPVNLDDVLLSNEGDHLIVSVVGGYISDEEIQVKEDKKDDYSPKKCNISRDVSIIDILLKRDFSAIEKQNIEDLKPNSITPTKTNDITKIKGWRTKNFTLPEPMEISKNIQSNACNDIVEEITIDEHPLADPSISKNLIQNYVDLSQPSTSQASLANDLLVNESLITETNKTEIEPLSILKQGEKSTLEDTKSAFISDKLDSFLNNDCELKISYEVPKLKAEEGITKPSSELPVASTYNEDKPIANYVKPIKIRKKESTIKPKTLAEKRKLLELERQNKLVHTMEANETTYLKQLGRMEKKCSVVKNIRNHLIKEDIPFSKQCWYLATKNDQDCLQYAVFNGQKIRILGSSGGDDIIINENEKSTVDSKRLNNLEDEIDTVDKSNSKSDINPVSNKLQYKPGPLSKKYKLLKSNIKNCEYEVRKLPKIKLILYPKIGKQIPLVAEKYLQFCKDEKGFISNEWAKFAVSAVVCNDKKESKVEFEIPYANYQNKILLRKVTRKSSDVGKVKNNSVDNEIKNIVSNMLDTIENQFLDETIIKIDPDLEELSSSSVVDDYKPLSPVDPIVQAIIKRRNSKQSRTSLELKRLNVKVIEVDVTEDIIKNSGKINCTNDYCLMGCVCKSLQVGGPVPDHCGRESCMFECTCTSNNSQQNKHNTISLPTGTDILSTSTMVRLQDEAVRYLAKEEKKFTQTVIKANNQTIVVGGGARERQKRITKVPKKYTDFINTSEEIINMQSTPEEIDDVKFTRKTVPIWHNSIVIPKIEPKVPKTDKKCYIKLKKLDCKEILPWCMVHNLYKCFCGGAPEVIENTFMQISKPEVEDSENYITYAPRYSAGRANTPKEIKSSLPLYSTEMEKYCARTRSLQTNYYQARNKSQTFRTRFAQMKKDEESFPVDMEPYINNSLQYKYKDGIKMKKRMLEDYSDKNLLTRKRPRKQNLLSNAKITESPFYLTENKTIGGICNEKELVNTTDNDYISRDSTPKERVKIASLIDYEKSFMGLLIPTEEWLQRFQRMLNLTTVKIQHIRLLQWTRLVQRYQNNMIQLWLNSKRNYNNVVLTENKKRPSRFHMNIKLFERTNIEQFKVPEIVMSLLGNKLPGTTTNEIETYVILVYYGLDWEARGTIVLNNTSEQCNLQLANKPTPLQVLSLDDNDVEIISEEVLTDPLQLSPEILINGSPMKDEIMKNSIEDECLNISPRTLTRLCKGVEITKIPMNEANLSPKINFDKLKENHNSLLIKKPDSVTRTVDNPSLNVFSATKPSKNILASLPVGKNKFRWFMLKLENDFSVLKISSTNFHIKYTHLTTAIQMARRNQKTVRIRSHDKDTPTNHDNSFGIYAVPDWSDRIFFGPYNNDEEHGLETFRYVNGKLLNTKTYNKMRGNTEEKATGLWFTHKSTLNNVLSLEPQFEEKSYPNSKCNTEVITADKAVKPQIEFVDLTENDSDDEDIDNNKKLSNSVDPLYNVLAADFSKHLIDDITIERISEDGKKTTINNDNKSQFVIKQNKINKPLMMTKRVDINELLTPKESSTNRGQKHKLPFEKQPMSKKQQMEIEIINLDEDRSNGMEISKIYPSQEAYIAAEKKKKMPQLYPINVFKTNEPKNAVEPVKMTSILKNVYSTSYITSTIPGFGYLEVWLCDDQYFVPGIIDGSKSPKKFNDIPATLIWLHSIITEKIFHLPKNINLGLAVWRGKDPPDMPKFKEKYWDGFHMICEQGIYDLFALKTNDIDDLGFTSLETTEILAYKCKVLIKKNIQILGSNLIGADADKLEDSKILDIAPQRIKNMDLKESSLLETKKKLLTMQKEHITKINKLLYDVPTPVSNKVRKNVRYILCKQFKMVSSEEETSAIITKNTKPINVLPAGKVFKIVDGNVIMIDKTIIPKTQSLKISPIKINAKSDTVCTKTTAPEQKQTMSMKFKLVNGSYLMPVNKPNGVVSVTSPKTLESKVKLVKNKLKNTPTVVDLTDS